MALQIVTANRLVDGAVVYLTADGGWSERLTGAGIADGTDEGARLMAAAERAVAERIVVAPYLIDVTVEHGTPRPVRFREAIRAAGPTVPSDFRTAAPEGL